MEANDSGGKAWHAEPLGAETRPVFTLGDGAERLTSPLALPDLTRAEALKVVRYMRLIQAPRDSVLFRAGHPDSPFMVMVMEGDALVEGRLAAATEPIVLRTLNAGCLFGEMGANDSPTRLITVRASSPVCVAIMTYADLQRLKGDNPVLGCALLQAGMAHVTRRLRSADTWIETLNQINRTLQEQWKAETRYDRAIVARLNVLMKLERQTGLRTHLVGDRIEVRPAG